MMKLKIIVPALLGAMALTLTFGACGKGKSGDKQNKPAAVPKDIAVDQQLRTRLEAFAEGMKLRGVFGFQVYDITANKPVYGYHEHHTQPSASCLKLLTGVVGLHFLGTHYNYRTAIFTKGRQVGDTLQGDVSFKADLDPLLQPEDLNMFVQALRRKGIKNIAGKLIFDLVLTDPVKSEVHWYPWDLSFSHYGLLYKGEAKVKQALQQSLRHAGIMVSDEQMVVAKTPAGSHCLFRFYRSIDRVIQRMWKNSSNTQATSLLYTIGHYYDPKQTPAEAGLAYLRHFMRKNLQLKDTALVIHDGCGLCTQNHLSPDALVIILRYGYAHPAIYEQLQRNLAIAGIDGTLHSLLRSDKLKGKIHGKTGTLSHPYGISSLAGYATGSNGHLLAFAIMDHQMSVLDARVLQRKLCELLVDKP